MKQQTSSATETQTKGSKIIDYSGKLIYVGIVSRMHYYTFYACCTQLSLKIGR